MRIKKETVIKVLPLLTAIVILSGLVKAIVYYKLFGLNILPYLELSECLLMFSDNLIFLVTINLFVILLVLYFSDWDISENTPNEIILVTSLDPPPFPSKKTYKIRIISTCIISILSLILIIWSFISQPLKFAIPLAIIILLTVGFLFFFPIIFEGFLKKYIISGTDEHIIEEFVIRFFIAIIIFSMAMSGAYEAIASKLSEKDNRFCVVFLPENRKIQSNKTLIYIGQTKNYIFFHNLKTEVNTIVPISEVKEMKIN